MQLEDAIKKRKSVRNFAVKKADWRKILQAVEYACYAPMAGNQYSLKYILVSDKNQVNTIGEACQQKFVGKSDYLLVVISDRNKVKKLYDYYEKGFGAQQAGAAIQNILLGLTERGLAACWVGFFEENIVKRVLGVSDSLTIEAVIPIGIENKSTETKPKLKPILSAMIYFDNWGKKYMGEDTKQKYDAS